MGKIKLIYWDGINFGDALSPYIVHKLSGKKVVYRVGYLGFIGSIKYAIKNLMHGRIRKLSTMLLPFESHLVAIGSILSSSSKYSKVWGAGFMNERDKFHGGEVYAVRGKFSDKKLQRMGYKGCNVYGDPALLMPLLYKPKKEKQYKIGIIPHWTETEFFKALYSDKFKVIDLRTTEVEKVIDEIALCEKILSTSLHGIIIAHAYNIPAIWISNSYIDTDGSKFVDYFSSVGIHTYVPYKNFDDIIKAGKYDEFFSENSDKVLPTIPIEAIQKNLLRVAPFTLLDEFER